MKIANGHFMGSILAPNAVFDTGFNVDGNIVAKEVTIGSENHRWDWMMPAYPVVPNPQPEPEPELQPKPTPNSDPEQPNFFPPALKIQTSRKHLNLVNPKSKLIYLMQVQLAKLQRPTIMRKYSFNLKQNAILAKQY
ncbi:choice-of-anchor A family protein [Lactobacillus amylovorus]|uniref:choice-of-anchor A family protein n=1 Tax=Lactobacillus amylovorus TaxID=1604 RepID=UPI000304278F|nr:choice-of-anchor A family protein [Lactobacillus amylovorus]KRK44916.1 hypothetical protein FC63_GL000024 [Lactobacillus amylovorus DSM 20531]